MDICHDFSTQPFLIRSPLFREFIALLVLLSGKKRERRKKINKKPELENLFSQLSFNSLMRLSDTTLSCILDLMNQMHYCEIFHSEKVL